MRGFGLRAGGSRLDRHHDAHKAWWWAFPTPRQCALCAARARGLGGGLVVARDGVIRGELALPIAGLLLPDRPLEEVTEPRSSLQDLFTRE